MELGLLSNSLLSRPVFHTTVTDPLLSAMSEWRSARTICPPPLSRNRLQEWRGVWADVRQCDTMFWVQNRGARPEPPIHLAAFLRFSAHRSAFIIDAWKYLRDKIGYFATVHRLDPCFLSYTEALAELKPRYRYAKFEWLPFGADTGVFYPRGEEKPVFAFWMGRRDKSLHNALLEYCQSRGLTYIYSNDGRYSTEQLGEIAAKAQYFLVTPPHPDRSGGYSPMPSRYVEGLAAGTRLLGVLPKSGEYQRLYPLNAVCQVAPDGSDLVQRLDEDRRNPENQRHVDRARDLVHRHHSWRRRAEQIVNRLDNGVEIEFPSPDDALRELDRERNAGRPAQVDPDNLRQSLSDPTISRV